MTALFLNVLNLSLQAGILVLVVLVLRLLFRQAPKWIHVLLWGLVALRLLCPLTIESPLSLMPRTDAAITEWTDDYVGDVQIIHQSTDGYDAAVNAGRPPISAGEGSYYVVTDTDGVSAPATVETDVLPLLSAVWLAGIAVIAGYTLMTTLRLRRSVATAVRVRNNIYQSECIDSPFVLGLLSPKVYLPYGVDSRDMAHVIAHEQTHIRRKDHLWKALGFLLLTVHWFNPLLWLGYVLFSRDVELACDEAVIKAMDNNERADYAQALLICSVRHKGVIACPVAFGELGVKQRVESVAAYKKPAVWVVAVSLAVCILAGICFLTAPEQESEAAAGLQLTDVAYYIELACPGETFDTMDSSRQEELLEEYGTLLEGYTLYARETADRSTGYIIGVWQGTAPAPLQDMLSFEYSPPNDDHVQLFYHSADYEAVELALAAGTLPDNACHLKNTSIYNVPDQGWFLIQPCANQLTLESPFSLCVNQGYDRANAQISDYLQRGITMTDFREPYLCVRLVSPVYGDTGEYILLTEEQVNTIESEPLTPIPNGYGFAATLRHQGENTYYTEFTDVPQTILDMAVQRCGYTFLRPADITGTITEAKLEGDWLDGPIYADAAGLPRLQEILKNAEFGFVGACGYGAKLTITCSDGNTYTLFKGTDGCDSMVFGSFGGYFIGNAENTEFWAMFGLDPDTKQPIN